MDAVVSSVGGITHADAEGFYDGGELILGDEASTSTQRDQLPDLVTVTGDRERLAAFDGIHDFLGFLP